MRGTTTSPAERWVGERFPRAREVFRPKKRHKVYADSEFAPEAVNYKSAQETEEQLRAKEEEGFVFPLTLAEARRRYGDKLRIAALGAIVKDSGEVRVVV